MKNILLIGNGFDLAHGLPTTYKDFLKFIEVIRQIINNEKGNDVDWKEIDDKVKIIVQKNMGNVPDNIFSQAKNWKELIEKKFWFDYFLNCTHYVKDDWIDFENEIRNVIKTFDKDIDGIDIDSNAGGKVLTLDFLRDYFITDIEKEKEKIRMEFMEKMENAHLSMQEEAEQIEKYLENCPIQCVQPITYSEIMKRMEMDLNKLILALEIYIADYIDKIPVTHKLPDIENLLQDFGEDGGNIENRYISFNYSHTLSRVYKVGIRNDKKEDILDFIHGEAREDRSKYFNNIVLGIDEYLDDEDKNKNVKFISYKKYYQRIFKETGNLALCWADEIRKDYVDYKSKIEYAREKSIYENNFSGHFYHTTLMLPIGEAPLSTNNLYIFGHSLDVTDKDVLRALILNDNVKTTVFYYSEEAHAQQIANLVKVIGQEELINRTRGLSKTITFVKQK